MSVVLKPNIKNTLKGQDGLADVIKKHLADYFSALNGNAPAPGLYKRILTEIEKPLIKEVLVYANGNNARAAQILGINRNTLRKKIQDLNIDLTKR